MVQCLRCFCRARVESMIIMDHIGLWLWATQRNRLSTFDLAAGWKQAVHNFTCSHDRMLRKAWAAQGCYGMLTFLELAHMADATPRLPPGSASRVGCLYSSLGPMSFETLIKSFQAKTKFHVLDRNKEHNGTMLPDYDVKDVKAATYKDRHQTQLVAISGPSSVTFVSSTIWKSQPKKALCKAFWSENTMNGYSSQDHANSLLEISGSFDRGFWNKRWTALWRQHCDHPSPVVLVPHLRLTG